MFEELGVFIHENGHRRVARWTIRCLGFTAAGLEILLNEVFNMPGADERWDLAGEVGIEPTIPESKSGALPVGYSPL